jgi:hypothetical protein
MYQNSSRGIEPDDRANVRRFSQTTFTVIWRRTRRRLELVLYPASFKPSLIGRPSQPWLAPKYVKADSDRPLSENGLRSL